jgi:hypothetical protein
VSCQPHAQPPTWRTISPYCYPQRQGCSAIPLDTGWLGYLRIAISLTHLHRPLRESKILNTQNSHSFIHSSHYLQTSLLVGLPASSGRQVRSYPQPASSSPRLSAHIDPGHEHQASDGRGSETSFSPHYNQSINHLENAKFNENALVVLLMVYENSVVVFSINYVILPFAMP